jgi:hypothetical protein
MYAEPHYLVGSKKSATTRNSDVVLPSGSRCGGCDTHALMASLMIGNHKAGGETDRVAAAMLGPHLVAHIRALINSYEPQGTVHEVRTKK